MTRFRYLWNEELQVKAHCIMRTVGTDGDDPRLIIAPAPEGADAPELHMLFVMKKDGTVVKCFAAYADDYYSLIDTFPYFDPKLGRNVARLKVSELARLPGFHDMTAEAIAAS